MSASETSSKPRGIVGYDPALEDELFAFQRAAYPERKPEWVEPRWRWMFLDSARRLDVDPMVWLYRAKTGIVAQQGAIPVRLKIGSDELTTGWFVETMVLESHRGKALGPMLIKKALEDLPLNLSLGQTADMREIQFALGWKQVAPLDVNMYVLNPQRVLAGKAGGKLSRMLASAALSTTQQLRRFNLRSRRQEKAETIQVDRFDERHDELWNRTSASVSCAVVRDASYLNWKYVDQPGQDFIRLEISRDGEALAVVVLQIREPDEQYRYRRCFIVEVVTQLTEVSLVSMTLQAALDTARKREADAVILPCVNSQLQESVARAGFLRRNPTRYFLTAALGAPEDLQQLIQTSSNWLVTMGDSDIDRPW